MFTIACHIIEYLHRKHLNLKIHNSYMFLFFLMHIRLLRILIINWRPVARVWPTELSTWVQNWTPQ